MAEGHLSLWLKLAATFPRDSVSDMTAGTSKEVGTPRQSALVIGAGVVGVATAYALARRGLAVTLVDQAAGVGQGASFANGAQLSYAYTDALATPKLLRHMPALALGLDPVFRLKPKLDPHYLGWLLRFVRNCTRDRALNATLAGLALGLESRLALHTLLDQHPLDFGHMAPGKLHLYKDKAGFSGAAALAEVKTAQGVHQQVLEPQAAMNIEPALAAYRDKFVGAIYSPEDELGDPHRFCIALIQVLMQSYDVILRTNVHVVDIQSRAAQPMAITATGEALPADHIVICAGLGSARLLGRFGLGGMLMPMKGYSITAPRGALAPKTSITDVSRKLVICPLSGAIRIAGLAELGEWDATVKPDRLAYMVDSAKAAFPEAALYDVPTTIWAGIRPMTANSLPIIQKVAPGITVNIGHGMLGWTYAMGSGERAAQSVLASEN